MSEKTTYLDVVIQKSEGGIQRFSYQLPDVDIKQAGRLGVELLCHLLKKREADLKVVRGQGGHDGGHGEQVQVWEGKLMHSVNLMDDDAMAAAMSVGVADPEEYQKVKVAGGKIVI